MHPLGLHTMAPPCFPRISAVAALLAVVARTPAALAQQQPQPPQTQPAMQPAPTEADLSAAREHFDRGIRLFDQGDNDGALAEFQRAWELSRRPSVLFNIAATNQALRRYGDAIAALERFLAEAPAEPRRQRRDAEHTLEELRQLIAHVRVVLDPEDATLVLDGRVQPTRTDLIVGPGTHRIQASRDGHRSLTEEFTIASGVTREIHLALQPGSGDVTQTTSGRPATLVVEGMPRGATLSIDGRVAAGLPTTLAPGPHVFEVRAAGYQPWSGSVLAQTGASHRLQVSLAPSDGSLRPMWFWIATAATGAFLLTTVVTGALALDANSDFRALPAGDPRAADLETSGRHLAAAADTFGVLTLGAAAAAVVLYFRTNLRASPSSAQFVLAPSYAGAALRF